jgi:glycosyltransferase involved in cell wall biosynthesis
MSVGIYIPAYNVGKYIGESISSITSQSYTDYEVVIIDDCSSDNTLDAAANSVKSDDSRFILKRREEHCGRIGQVKNEAIALLGDHEYICHVGSDDIIPENCLELFVNYMDKNPEIGACCGNFICFNDQGQQWTLPHVANSGDYDPSTLLRFMCLFPMRFYRKSVVEKVGGYSNELTSAVDYDLALKVDEVTRIHRIKDPVTYYYRQHDFQVSTRARPEQDQNAKRALQNALVRRNIEGKIVGDRPPFRVEMKTPKVEEHFIWGKK